MASELLVAVAVGALVILAKLGFFRWLYKRLRCIYYLRKLPMILQPHRVTGHSYHAHPERMFGFIQQYQQSEEYTTNPVGVYRTDMAAFVHMASMETPDTVAMILKSSEPKNPYVYSFLMPWIGDGLLISNGMKWARNRRLLTPAFHFDILKGYASVYSSAVGVLVEKWRAASSDSENSMSARVDISRDVALLSLDVILQCAMSYHSDCQISPNEYAESVMTLVVQTMLRGVNLAHHPDILFALSANGRIYRKACSTAHQYSEALIKERRKNLAVDENEDAERAKDFLDILLTARDTDGAGLSDIDIRNEVDTFLFEGHDTTASALQWTLYFLAGHPDVQERCRKEAQYVASSQGLAVGEVTYQSLQKLEYTEQALKEAMRLATTVPLIYRHLTRDITVKGYFIPEGAWVTVNLFSLHHHPVYWPEPMKYDPSRFDANAENNARAAFSFVPFSGGPRNCIGQNLAMEEMKSAVSLILQEFRLSLPEDMHDIQQHLYLVNRPSKAIELIVESLTE